MEITFDFPNKFQVEKKYWLDYLIKEQNFKQVNFQSETLINPNSVFSANPQFLKLEVDFTNFPQIKVIGKNLFFSPVLQKKLMENWCYHLEEQVFIFAKTDQLISMPIVSLISSKTMGGFSELLSRLVAPMAVIIFINLIIYTLLCFALLKGMMEEVYYLDGASPGYLNYNQLKPTVTSLYQSNLEILHASFLCALLGGGWFLGAQQLLICFYLKFSGKISRNVIVSILILSLLQGLLFFTQINWILVFCPITIFSYLVFVFFSRKLPVFIEENSL